MANPTKTKVKRKGTTLVPEIGRVYTDSDGRELRVEKIDMNDPQTSHVKGKIKTREGYFDYSCMLDLWVKIWHEKAPNAERAGMEA